MEKQKILIVTGEPSGDLHASNLISYLNRRGDFKFFGVGGRNLKSQGVKIFFDIKDLAVMGFWEVIRKFLRIKKIFHSLLEITDREKPKFAILVDYPGFNLRLARELRKRNITIIYYISPQVWAWGSKRIKIIKELVNLMVVFFKFEEELYKNKGVPVVYFGHPLLEIVKPKISREEIHKKFSLPYTQYTVSLLPGSRAQEVKKILPLMLKTAEILYRDLKDVKFLILRTSLVSEEIFKKALKNYRIPVYLLSDLSYEGLSLSDFAMVASGTATLETAILEVPMVIIYK
ncbi:MAG: lipid-A-disaccharide synthase, partial [Candidatus Omnitrophica bacterium]|nr:lipid-A-disaccharide synthase [Candidatus Omnitrophota bacterium]